MPATCQLKRNALRGCNQPASSTCQYCGRWFCSSHGERFADGQEVCTRPRCREKLKDLQEHETYREGVYLKNRAGRCGEGECEELYQGQCSKCMGFYCEAHTAERPHHVIVHGHRTPRMGALCAHCWARRDLWERF